MPSFPSIRLDQVRRAAGACLLAATLLPALGACSRREIRPEDLPYCPTPSLVNGLERAEGKAPDGQTLWTAQLTHLGGNCSPREFDYLVDINLTVDLRSSPERPPGPVQLTYFVAVTSPDGTVIDKQTFPVILEPGNTGRATRLETLRQRLPLEQDNAPAHWTVLIGFEPTADQIRARSAEPTQPAQPASP